MALASGWAASGLIGLALPLGAGGLMVMLLLVVVFGASAGGLATGSRGAGCALRVVVVVVVLLVGGVTMTVSGLASTGGVTMMVLGLGSTITGAGAELSTITVSFSRTGLMTVVGPVSGPGRVAK